MSFIEREQGRIQRAMRAAPDGVRIQLEAAAQALAWATDPTQFASPVASITGISAGSKDCQVHHGPPRSLCSDYQSDSGR
jgi:hypothetical protein